MIPPKRVEQVPGTDVFVREMSVGEFVDFQDKSEGKSNAEIEALVIRYCLCDEQGTRLHNGDTPDISDWPLGYVLKVCGAINDVNGWSDDPGNS